MDELGSILREAREAKGLSLNQVHVETRIPQKYLTALEGGEYDRLPTPVHVRGYLGNYARVLGLDAGPLIERYEVSKQYRPPPIPTVPTQATTGDPLPSRSDQPFFNPVNLELGPTRSRDPETLMRWAIILALLFFIALAANRFLFSSNSQQGNLEDAVATILEPQNTPETVTTPLPTPTDDLSIISTSRNSLELPTPTATRPLLPATMESIDILVEVTERTWFRITVDGEVVHEGLGRKGESYQWEAQQSVTLLTGNAIGTFVTINNTELGRLGGRGQVVEETWTTSGG